MNLSTGLMNWVNRVEYHGISLNTIIHIQLIFLSILGYFDLKKENILIVTNELLKYVIKHNENSESQCESFAPKLIVGVEGYYISSSLMKRASRASR